MVVKLNKSAIPLMPLEQIPLDPARVEAMRFTAGVLSPNSVSRPWSELLQWSLSDGYAGLFRQQMQQYPEVTLTESDADVLAKTLMRMKATYLYQETCWREIAARFDSEGLKVLSLKGWALDRTVYPEPGLREMCDWDLLVGKGDVERAVALLMEMGFQSAWWDDPAVRHYLKEQSFEFELYRHQWPLIDLHSAIAHEISPLASEEMLEAAIPGPVKGELVPHQDHLLFHVLHHGTRSGSGYRLVWPLDVSQNFRRNPGQEKAMIERMAELAIRWDAPLFILQAFRELRAFLGIDTGEQERRLEKELRFPEKILSRSWRQEIGSRLTMSIQIAHRFARRAVVGQASIFGSLVPPPGHTVIQYNIRSTSPDFWKYRLRDFARRLTKK